MTQTFRPNLFTRDDTFLGVCEALGEDFHFNPLLLRVAFGVSLLYSPMLSLATYAALGAVVLISRLISPNPRQPRPAPAVEEMEASPEPLHADNETVADVLAVAA